MLKKIICMNVSQLCNKILMCVQIYYIVFLCSEEIINWQSGNSILPKTFKILESVALPMTFVATHLYVPASVHFISHMVNLFVALTTLSLWVMVKLASGKPSDVHNRTSGVPSVGFFGVSEIVVAVSWSAKQQIFAMVLHDISKMVSYEFHQAFSVMVFLCTQPYF